VKSWKEFSLEEPDLADFGKHMLLQTWAHTGLGYLATLRKDGAPRQHPTWSSQMIICLSSFRLNLQSVVISNEMVDTLYRLFQPQITSKVKNSTLRELPDVV
jgi:hypothetical protein